MRVAGEDQNKPAAAPKKEKRVSLNPQPIIDAKTEAVKSEG